MVSFSGQSATAWDLRSGERLGGSVALGEAVGVRRWTAIAIGFLGVLIIIRPGTDGFTVWSLFALAARRNPIGDRR